MSVACEQDPEARHRFASRADWSRVQIVNKVNAGILLLLNLNHNIRVHWFKITGLGLTYLQSVKGPTLSSFT